ncbi:MAG: hypothetical protein AAB583_05860 [Patescibacteria group bacterium]
MPEGNQEAPTAQSLDTKLKEDSLDLTPYHDEKRVLAGTGVAMALVTTGYLLPDIIDTQIRSHIFPSAITLSGFAFGDLMLMRHHWDKARKLEQIHSISDDALGYRADRFVYQGRKPIEVSDQKFTKGDNFYFIRLPPIPDIMQSQPEALAVWLDLYSYSLREIKERLVGKNYQFVAIEGGQTIEGIQSASRKEV